MNIEDLKKNDLILYETIVGSQAYGTNNENSDIDLKGLFWINSKEFLSLNPPVTPQQGQIGDEKHNVVYYSVYRTLELLKDANPNFIELLWMPDRCVQVKKHNVIGELFEQRNMFITKMAYKSHASYAYAQIKKAKGKNKKVHNPQPEKMPSKENFCRVILFENLQGLLDINKAIYPINESNDFTFKGLYPFRPVPLNQTIVNLSECHVASLEHAPNVYRLYMYGENAKGVFRGNDMLVCESIPKEDEWAKCIGLLIYDQNEFEKAKKEWKSYWDWKNERNDSRWIDQEKGLLTYDAKNIMHCIRLLMESEHILTVGHPMVEIEGDQLKYLKSIRNGELEYEDLMKDAEIREKRLEDLYRKSKLPEVCDEEKLASLYKHIMELGEKYYES